MDLILNHGQKPYLSEQGTLTFSDAVTLMEYALDTAMRAQRLIR